MIAAIELAMLARLKVVADADALGFRWKMLETYPEDWDAYLRSQSEIRTPAAWVVFAGWNRAERGEDGVVTVDASFGVMVADENLRAPEQYQRHGGADPAIEPGSYRLALAAVASLAGQDLGLDLARPLEVGAMRAVRPSEAITKRKLSMYAIEFTVGVPIALVTADTGPVEQLHANWDIPAFGTPFPVDRDAVAPGAQLPDDDHADATDTVQLEQQI